MENTTQRPSIGIPFFSWIDEDVVQDGTLIKAWEGRRCPKCGVVVPAKSNRNGSDFRHWRSMHEGAES